MSFSDGRLIKRVYVSTSESEILSEGKMHMCSRDQVSNMRSTSHPGRANNTVIIPRYASDSKMKAQEGVENPNSLFNLLNVSNLDCLANISMTNYMILSNIINFFALKLFNSKVKLIKPKSISES